MGWFDGVSEHGNSSSHGHSSSHRKHSSSQSIFGGRSSSSSYYKRSPRKGYIARMYSKLRHLLRDLMYYLKRNPVKVFMLVIMPLVTGGALTALLRRFGIRLPDGVERMMASMAGKSGGFGEGGRHGNSNAEGPLGNLGAMAGMAGGAGQLLNVAKMFL